jgi:hypothetical protein
MSADACLVFFGIRQEVAAEEVEELETRKHPLLGRCRQAGLHFFWANFESPTEKYYAFIGHQIGLFGPEHKLVLDVSADSLAEVVVRIRQTLANAGFGGDPRLFVQWIPDV